MKNEKPCYKQIPKQPRPYGPVPTKRQLDWHTLEFYGFLHFTVNTFTDQEWGYGHEDRDLFNPSAFDADQIVETAKMAGMKGLILTCKHHDGFCLWPTRETQHCVRNISWRKGKGDVVGDVSKACARHGIKFGVYLSPWDRNHKEYARPAYISYYRKQLADLMTNYGPIFEVWFDGANGGDGFYGGAREKRSIDSSTYYGWNTTWGIVRRLQPNACIFGDVGADVRWVGNESGYAGDPCWATYSPCGLNGKKPAPGATVYQEGETGHRDGKFWMPAECDVSIRPGWFYHRSEDEKVRSPENLLDLYFKSVGRGASFLLNLPPDRRGLVHENDVASLRGFRGILNKLFKTDLARQAVVTASNTRENHPGYAPSNVLDGCRDTYWSTDDLLKNSSVTLDFKRPVTFNVISLREYLPLGQRVEEFAIDVWHGGSWRCHSKGESIGSRRLISGKKTTTTRLRFRVMKAPVCPAISEIGLFAGPC